MVAVRSDAATSVKLMVSRRHCLRQLLKAPMYTACPFFVKLPLSIGKDLWGSRGTRFSRQAWQPVGGACSASLGGTLAPSTSGVHILLGMSHAGCDAQRGCRHCPLPMCAQAFALCNGV